MSQATRPYHLKPFHRHRAIVERFATRTVVFAIVVAFSLFMGLGFGLLGPMAPSFFAPVIGVMFLLAIWLLPDASIDLSKGAFVAFLAYVSASLVWPNYLAVAIPGLPWITPTRMFLFALGLLVLLQYSQNSIARREIVGSIHASHVFLVAILIHIACRFASLPVSPSPFSSATSIFQTIILCGIPFIAAVWLLNGEKRLDRFAGVVVACTIAVLIVSVAEYRISKPIWTDHLPSFLIADQTLFEAYTGAQARVGDNRYRVRGVFGTAVYFGQYLAVATPFIMHALFTARTALRRVIYAIVMLVLTFVVWSTNTRTAMTGMMIGLVGYGALFALRRYLFPRYHGDPGSPIALASGIGGALTAVVLVLSSHRLRVMTLGGAQHADSDRVREAQWDRAIELMMKNPLGYGADQAPMLAGKLSNRGIWVLDNGWINMMVDFGAVGAASFLCAILYLCYRLLRIYFSPEGEKHALALPLAAGLALFLLTLVSVSASVSFPFIFLLVGVSVALIGRVGAPDRKRAPVASGSPRERSLAPALLGHR